MKVFVGDICNKRTVQDCCDGVDAVFHIASFGMSGRGNKPLFENIHLQK